MLTTNQNYRSPSNHYQLPKNAIDDGISRNFKKGEIFPLDSHNLWLLKRGVVKTLTYSEKGKTIVLGYWGAGDIVGVPLSNVTPYEIQCLSSVEAIYIDKEQYSCLLTRMISCVQQTDELLRIVRVEKMYYRLVKALIWLTNKFGIEVSQGVLIDVRLTHQDIADIIGSTRVTVTRLLNQLTEEDLIFRSQRFSIIVKDLSLLQKKIKI